MASKILRAAIVATIATLGGCFVRTDVRSVVVFEGSYDAAFVENLKSKVRLESEMIGGQCNDSGVGITCRFDEKNSSSFTDINSGISGDTGYPYIAVHSEIGSILPYSDEQLIAGRGLPELHVRLEAWLVREFSNLDSAVRARRYSGRDIVTTF